MIFRLPVVFIAALIPAVFLVACIRRARRHRSQSGTLSLVLCLVILGMLAAIWR